MAQDGYAAGEYTNFQINDDGTVVGISTADPGPGADCDGQLLFNPEGLASGAMRLAGDRLGPATVGLSGGGLAS